MSYFPSATHLVKLDLSDVRLFPPEVMVTSLSAMTSLESLCFYCEALKNRRLPPLTRSILPSLTTIQFIGASEYLEEILARIDAPRLNKNAYDIIQ